MQAPMSFPSADAKWWEGGQKVQAQAEFETRKLNTQLDKMTRRQSGRRSSPACRKLSDAHGRFYEANGRTYFMCYHPAAALRNPELKDVMREDFAKLKQELV